MLYVLVLLAGRAYWIRVVVRGRRGRRRIRAVHVLIVVVVLLILVVSRLVRAWVHVEVSVIIVD